MDNKQIAKEVIEALGGRENVNSVAHCATRLRVMVKDENKINKEKADQQIKAGKKAKAVSVNTTV